VSDQIHAPAVLPAGTHYIGGWVGPQSRSGRCGEDKKNPFTAPAGNRTPAVQPVATQILADIDR